MPKLLVQISTTDCEPGEAYQEETVFPAGMHVSALIDVIHGIDTFYSHKIIESLYIEIVDVTES